MTEPRDPSRIPPNPSRGANPSRGHRTASGESSSILCHAATPPHTFTTLRTWVLAYLGWLWLLAMQLPADATTLIPMNERELAIRSSAAITGTVKRIEAAASDPKGPIFTYVFIDPEEVIFGTLPAGKIVLRELGGTLATRQEWVFGNPEFFVGERLLVFLSRNSDGSLRTTAKCLGKYQLSTTRRGTRIATRHIGRGVDVLDSQGRQGGSGQRVDRHLLQRLIRRIQRAAKTSHRRSTNPGVELVPPELEDAVVRETHAAFTLLGPESRWFEPDDGEPVLYTIDSSGDETFGPEGSLQLLQNAFEAWSTISLSALHLGEGGPAEPAPFAGCPDDNRIVFNDPFEEIDDPTNCRGVLALGGFCTSGGSKLVNGINFRRITTGKVTFNNGWSNCGVWTPCNVAEIATHELGHTVGFGHSADVEATMAASAHVDGRCASLRDDDVAAAIFVYPAVPSPTPSSTPDWSPTPSHSP